MKTNNGSVEEKADFGKKTKKNKKAKNSSEIKLVCFLSQLQMSSCETYKAHTCCFQLGAIWVAFSHADDDDKHAGQQ